MSKNDDSLNLTDSSRSIGAGDATKGSGTAGHTWRREIGFVDYVIKLTANVYVEVAPR